ncbi:hypothetical protein BDR22DRAFT_894472 [Usnea florida]
MTPRKPHKELKTPMTPSSSTKGTTFNEQMEILYRKAEGTEQEALQTYRNVPYDLPEPTHPTSEYITRVCHGNDLRTKKTGRDLVAQYLTFKAYRCSPSDSVWPSRRAKIMTQNHAGEILHIICQHFDRSVLLLLPVQSFSFCARQGSEQLHRELDDTEIQLRMGSRSNPISSSRSNGHRQEGVRNNNIGLENHKLVSDYGIKNGDHFRTAKAKHKRANPPSRVRHQRKASKLRDELDAIEEKMSPDQRAAFHKEVAEDIAVDNEEAGEVAGCIPHNMKSSCRNVG